MFGDARDGQEEIHTALILKELSRIEQSRAERSDAAWSGVELSSVILTCVMYPRGDKLNVGSSSFNAAPDSGDFADQT